MTLNILISTIDNGINKLPKVLLAYRKDVKYIVSHQYRDERYLPIPKELIRDDVLVSQIPGQGLTKSRNNAIRLATADICVIADDDVKYRDEYFDTILQVYRNSKIDIACFKIFTGEGNPGYKNYPATEMIINRIHTHCVSSIEMTFRLQPVLKKEIFFDERFGLGSWLAGGEEKIFIFDAINAGIKVEFFPHYIVQHPYESTIKYFPKYAKIRVHVGGALDARLNGSVSIVKALAVTFRLLPDLLKNKKNPFLYLYERLSGNIYILKLSKNKLYESYTHRGYMPKFYEGSTHLHTISEAQKTDRNIDCRLIHTGQHHDQKMNDTFVKELNNPQPNASLGCGGGTQAEQTAAIVVAFEKELVENPADLFVVASDVTSTILSEARTFHPNPRSVQQPPGLG